MNTKQGFSTLLTILITAVVVGVLVGVITYSYAVSKKDLEIEDLREQLSQAKEQASVEPGSMILDTSETDNQQPIAETPSTITDETTNWKTYANDKYGFSFKYPGDWEKTSDNVQKDSTDVLFKQNSETPLIVRLSTKGHSDPTIYFDTEKNTERTYPAGKSDEFILPNGYGDAGTITPPFIIERFIKDGKVYAFEFYGDTKLSDTENQILSTFQFTK